MKKIYYTIYKTTNLINNKCYIGVHKTTNINDSYLGSGNVIKQAIKKHGRINFNKEILYIFNSAEEAYDKEKEIVNNIFIKDKNTYNIALGGVPTTDCYPNRRYLTGKDHPMCGKKHSDESNKRRAEKLKGKKMSIESRLKMSKSQKGHKSWNKGKNLTKLDKLAKSIAALKLKKIECPHCKKLSDPGNSKKWHFDNCKHKKLD
jgi:group I intron endonuclease